MPGEFSNCRCPKCGSMLLIQGDRVWCSLVPGRDGRGGCDWGLSERKTIADTASSSRPGGGGPDEGRQQGGGAER